MIGKTFSHYEVLEKLGEGGMGEVYLAMDTELDRKVALKFLPSQYAHDEDFRTRFKREARAAAALSHPNIVTIHEVAEYEARPYIAMEYIDGLSLKELVAEEHLSINRAVDIAVQICEGLSAAHKAGILHRDIKPHNVLIGRDGRARILDFGLAKLRTDSMITETGSTVGTVAYMSPEQAQKAELDERSDIFSFGIVFYEMITGQVPFKGDHPAAVMYSIVHETPEPPARYRADVPEALQRVVEKALRKDRDTRYQSAAEILADLREFQTAETTRATASAGRLQAAGRRPSSRLGLIGGLIAVLAVILIARLYLMDAPKEPETPATPQVQATPDSTWKNSVAVLPFRDFSPDKDQEYFCDGMTDAIIGRLAGIEDLKIISLSSAMRYKDTDRNLREIGEELGVSTILEGSIQKEENRIRLSAQLINVADDAHLWSQTYDRELESVFAIQDEISQAIVDVLKIRLLGEDRTSFGKRYTDNVEAYNAYAQGRFLWNKRTEETLMRSIDYFERAIELDPEYALAYAGLADAYGVLPSNIGYPVEKALPKGKAAAQKALELDNELGEARASMGLLLKMEGDLEGAEREYLRAIELNPGYAYAHYWYAMLLDEMVRREEARQELEIAYELDPLSVVILTYLCCNVERQGDSLQAERLFERAVEIEPSRASTYVSYASCLRDVGRNEEADSLYLKAVEVDPEYAEGHNSLAHIYCYAGDLDRALEAANRYLELTPNKANAYDTMGEIYAFHGDLEGAILHFQRALETDPNFGPAKEKLAGSYVFKREYAKARRLYEELASSSDAYDSLSGRAGLWMLPLHQGKIQSALEALDEEPVSYDSKPVGLLQASIVHQLKLYVYLEREDLDLVLRELDILRELTEEFDPTDRKKARDGYAIVWAMQGKIAEAEEALQGWRADIEGGTPAQLQEYWIARGIFGMITEDYDAAIANLERGLRALSKPIFDVLYFLALTHLEAGQPQEAANVLEQAIRRYDERRLQRPLWSVKAHYHLGLAYEQLGRNEEAVGQLQEFLEIWKEADSGIPEIDDARERLRRLRSGT